MSTGTYNQGCCSAWRLARGKTTAAERVGQAARARAAAVKVVVEATVAAGVKAEGSAVEVDTAAMEVVRSTSRYRR